MRKLLLLLLCSAAFGQAVRYDLPPVLNSRGVPIANPQISLCTGLAVINGTTCSIQATSFTDITLGTPCAGGSPVTLANSNVCRATGDALGNAGFWLTPGAYIYCVTAPSITGQCYNLTVPVGNTAGGAATITGVLTAQSVNGVLWVGPGSGEYATCAAAVTAAGAINKTIIAISPNYTGAACPANLAFNNTNIVIQDYSGGMNPSSAPFLGDTFNFSDGNVFSLHRSNLGVSAFPGANAAIVNGYWITAMTNASGNTGTMDGISAEADFFGTLSGTQSTVQAAEHSVTVNSTGGTITVARGGIGYVNTGVSSTTAIGTVAGFYGIGCNVISGSVPTNCYGLFGNDQGNKGATRNYAIYGIGRWLVGYSATTAGAAIQFEDSSNVAHSTLLVDSTGLFNIQAPTATGTALEDNGGNIKALVNSSGFLVRNGASSNFIASNATATRTATLPDQTGTVILNTGATSQKAETGSADANVLTVTPLAFAGLYRACFVVSVSSATTGVIAWTLSWTDSNGNVQSNIAQDLFQDGTAAPATTFTTSAAGNYHFCREFDINNAAASIIVKWVGGGTTAAKVSATVERII